MLTKQSALCSLICSLVNFTFSCQNKIQHQHIPNQHGGLGSLQCFKKTVCRTCRFGAASACVCRPTRMFASRSAMASIVLEKCFAKLIRLNLVQKHKTMGDVLPCVAFFMIRIGNQWAWNLNPCLNDVLVKYSHLDCICKKMIDMIVYCKLENSTCTCTCNCPGFAKLHCFEQIPILIQICFDSCGSTFLHCL